MTDERNEQNKAEDEQKTELPTGGITGGMKAVLPPLWERYTKEEFMSVVEHNVGITTAVCNQLDCTFTQYWNAVKKWGLQEFVQQQKSNLVSIAEHVLVDCLNSSDEKMRFQASQYVLKTVGRKDGWGSENSNVVATQIDVGNGAMSIKQIFGIPEANENDDGKEAEA